jgi:hypothetical protein
MMHLLFESFHAATLTMTADGALLLSGARERVLAWGVVFCVLAAMALVLWLSGIRRRLALALLALALLIPALVMPGLRREKIQVLPDSIVVDRGGRLLPDTTAIDLRNLDRIRETNMEIRIAGYIVESNALWQLEYTDGHRRQLLLNGFFTAHRMAIAQYLRDRGHIVI